MSVVILCDGGENIGAGHFFRCLAIAEELISRGVSVCFLLPNNALREQMTTYGFMHSIINDMYSHSNHIMGIVISELKKYKCDIVLVDSHRVSEELLSNLYSCFRVVYIDDMLLFPYSAHCVINMHIDVTKNDYKVLYEQSGIPLPELLVGGKFFPIRRFLPMEMQHHKNVKNVVFMAGGSDPDHVTLRLLKYIKHNQIEIDYNLCVVVGPLNTDYEEIRKISLSLQMVHVLYKQNELYPIFAASDLAITAAGISLYELAHFGIPCVSYSMVDNQIHSSLAFNEKGISIHVGDSRKDDIFKGILQSTANLLIDEEKREKMRVAGIDTIDGLGAERIANYLLTQF